MDQVCPAVQQRIDCQHGRPVSGEEYAKHRDAKEGEKLQIRRKEPPQGDRPGIYNAGGVQQRDAGQGHKSGGNQGKGQAGKDTRHKDGLPPHRHGVQPHAQPGVEEIPKEQHGDQRAEQQVHRHHDLDALRHPGGKPEAAGHVPVILVHEQKPQK